MSFKTSQDHLHFFKFCTITKTKCNHLKLRMSLNDTLTLLTLAINEPGFLCDFLVLRKECKLKQSGN